MSQITALSLEESKRLLYAATQLQGGAAAASVAIGLFAGLRPSEICDLKTEDILEERSGYPAARCVGNSSARCRSRRYSPLG